MKIDQEKLIQKVEEYYEKTPMPVLEKRAIPIILALLYAVSYVGTNLLISGINYLFPQYNLHLSPEYSAILSILPVAAIIGIARINKRKNG